AAGTPAGPLPTSEPVLSHSIVTPNAPAVENGRKFAIAVFIGISQIPANTLPKLPFMPIALLRPHHPPSVTPVTSNVLSHWNHAETAPPNCSSPLNPRLASCELNMSLFTRP